MLDIQALTCYEGRSFDARPLVSLLSKPGKEVGPRYVFGQAQWPACYHLASIVTQNGRARSSRPVGFIHSVALDQGGKYIGFSMNRISLRDRSFFTQEGYTQEALVSALIRACEMYWGGFFHAYQAEIISGCLPDPKSPTLSSLFETLGYRKDSRTGHFTKGGF